MYVSQVYNTQLNKQVICNWLSTFLTCVKFRSLCSYCSRISDQLLSFSCSFRGKFGQIISWPQVWEILDPPLQKSRSTRSIILIKFVKFMAISLICINMLYKSASPDKTTGLFSLYVLITSDSKSQHYPF